jgi:ankyrin repeat protein
MNNITSELFEAIKSYDLIRFQQLVGQAPESLEAKDESGNSPLLLAAYYGAKDIAAFILEIGIRANLFEAAAVGLSTRVIFLLAEEPEAINQFSHDGFTVLGLASFFGHQSIVEFALERGAQVNLPSNNPMQVMPLHSAAAHRHMSIARRLLDAGAEVNAKQHGGWTPLHSAVQNKQIPLVELLLERGADPNLSNDAGLTALAIAQAAADEESIALLRKHSAEP